MDMKMYQYTEAELQQFANQVKDNVILALGKEELLTKSAEHLAGNCIVVVGHKGMFGKIFDKLRGIKDNNMFMLVQIFRDGTSEVQEADDE